MERQIGLLIVSMLIMLPSSGCSIVMALNGHAVSRSLPLCPNLPVFQPDLQAF